MLFYFIFKMLKKLVGNPPPKPYKTEKLNLKVVILQLGVPTLLITNFILSTF